MSKKKDNKDLAKEEIITKIKEPKKEEKIFYVNKIRFLKKPAGYIWQDTEINQKVLDGVKTGNIIIKTCKDGENNNGE